MVIAGSVFSSRNFDGDNIRTFVGDKGGIKDCISTSTTIPKTHHKSTHQGRGGKGRVLSMKSRFMVKSTGVGSSSSSSGSWYIRIVFPILAGGHPGVVFWRGFILRRGERRTRGVSGRMTMVSSGQICSDE